MNLLHRVKRAPLWRSHGLPYGSRRVALACFQSELPHLGSVLAHNLLSMLDRIALFDHHPSLPRSLHLVSETGAAIILPVVAVDSLQDAVHLEILFFNKQYSFDNLTAAQAALAAVGFQSWHMLMPYLHHEGHQTLHLPDYLATRRQALEQAFALLEDEESRQVFASRIRALCTGNVGYLQLVDYPQYFHPLVRPLPGDVVIDGGVSGIIDEQAAMLAAVSPAGGPRGRMVGFEPDPAGHADARAKLQALPQAGAYTLLAAGLWHEQTTVHFTPAGVGSHVAGTADDAARGQAIPVAMTTVDATVAELGLERVDFIKLDVEGAERQALEGAERTIARYRPRLAVSVYHLPDDLHALPLLLQAMLPDYRFFLGHHHPVLFETILYAAPRP